MHNLSTIQAVVDDFRKHPIQAAQFFISSQFKPGFNILDDNWELAIILDTCRPDALCEVSSEYSFISDIQTRWSIGGATPEWLVNTFDSERAAECNNIGYIAANGYVAAVFEDRASPSGDTYNWSIPSNYSPVYPDEFDFIDHIWRAGVGWEDIGEEHPPASYVTNQAIWRYRNDDMDRLIAHYIQPHAPYVGHARRSNRDFLDEFERDPFSYLRKTDDLDTVWNAYLTELKCALDEIEVLLNNIDVDDVIITADHGEAFGEFRSYGHRSGMLQPPVRRVPWVRTTASDEQTRDPERIKMDAKTGDVAQQLQALGYK